MKRSRLSRKGSKPRKQRLNVVDMIPKPDSPNIRIEKVEDIIVPHPYCITPKHLLPGRMYLDESTIKEAEQQGAQCDICRVRVKKGLQSSVLSVDEHRKQKTLFLEVPKGDLNSIPGLHEYLLKIKPKLMELKIDGIAFKQV